MRINYYEFYINMNKLLCILPVIESICSLEKKYRRQAKILMGILMSNQYFIDLMRRQEELRRLEELRNQELQKRKQIQLR